MEKTDYFKMTDHKGPSGVPLGGIGSGYFSIDPSGYINRINVNNIHKDFFPKNQKGFFAAVWQGGESPRAARIQLGKEKKLGLEGFDHIEYTGIFPFCTLKAENDTQLFDFDVSLKGYSYLIPHNIKDSSLPAAWIDICLSNRTDQNIEVAAALSWGDVIYRGMKDFNEPVSNAKFSGDSLPFIKPVNTAAKPVYIDAGMNRYAGVKQYAKEIYSPVKWTFQSYNSEFLILAEESEDCEISMIPAYGFGSGYFPQTFEKSGCFADTPSDYTVDLSYGGDPNNVCAASAVSIKSSLAPFEEKTFRFMLLWFMPKTNPEEIQKGPEGSFFKNCDYGKYYHNWFDNSESLAAYVSAIREEAVYKTEEWQAPILMSSLPQWLKFKEINSAYALYTNTVLTESGLFSTLEGEMGGLGGTQDQKLSSHPVYQKFFTELDIQENMQYYNTIGDDGEILHFDLHYYHGISSSDPGKKESATPLGCMIDNGGSWIIQNAKTYDQTGNKKLLESIYPGVKSCMDFIYGKIPEEGMHIPCFSTTYDDAQHPPVFIYSGTIYLAILKAAIHIAEAMEDIQTVRKYKAEFEKTLISLEKLFVENPSGEGFYCFGSEKDGSDLRTNIIFSGHLAGQFISRYCGLGDILPFEKCISSMKKLLTTSVQSAKDYYAAKIWDFEKNLSLDNAGSRCWPFYLESYTAMAAIQLGYVEDGLKIMAHIQKVHYDLGYTWTQNLWNPAEVTYMTVPVTWFINDVLTGAALDVNSHTLTLGPVLPENKEEHITIPLYYPDFWAVLDFCEADGTCSFEILKTYGDTIHSINNIRILPSGRPSSEAVTKTLEKDFIIQDGNILDLGFCCEEFKKSRKIPSVLKPVPPYSENLSSKTEIDTGESLYI